MAGLLDSIFGGSQGGYGGLLDSLLYPSPINQKNTDPQAQYDPMGNYTGITPQAPNPFGALPQMNQPPPGYYAPPSPFNNGASPLFTGMQQAASTQAPVSPPPQAQIPPQVNDIKVGDYQMPRIGSVADYTSQQPKTPTDISAQSRQPTLSNPQQTQPTFLSDQGGLAAGARGFVNNLHGGLGSAIVGGIGNALGMQDPAQRNMKAEYDALVPLVGQQKALLAVLDPVSKKTILDQALEKKQYSFAKTDQGEIVNQDPLTGKVEVAYGGGDRASSIPGPDGKPIQIPAGLDPSARKTFVDEVARNNAKVVGGELTQAQAQATLYASKMELSNKSITDGVGTSLAGKIASGLPLGNYAQSPEYQKYKQASSNFITALLRQESGAAISKSEFDRYDKEYMPQPGDSKDVLTQKAEARRVAIEGMKKGAGPSYKSPTSAGNTTQSGVSWSIVQ